MEVTLEGVSYRTGRLDAFEQFHIARRLAPLLATLGMKAKDLKTLAVSTNGSESKDEDLEALDAVLEPLAQCLAKMSDEDTNYIINTCLAVCTRKQPTGWAPVMSKSGTRKLLFQDIGLPVLMGLTINTIQENMASFFPTEPKSSQAK